VIARLQAAGYRWYETANFCRDNRRAQHNLAYWTGRDYLGIGIGAVSTLGLERRTNRPSLPGFIEALERGAEPPRSLELLSPEERARERVLLGLRLDVPLSLAGLEHAIDPDGLARMAGLGLIEAAAGTLRLTPRGRLLANDVVSNVIA
jgi:oxygen-independent coproporphyrinogen-3 oxidase